MKHELSIAEGRCDICTLKPPCRHIKEDPNRIAEDPNEDSLFNPDLAGAQLNHQSHGDSFHKTPDPIQQNDYENPEPIQPTGYLNNVSENSPRVNMNTSRYS